MNAEQYEAKLMEIEQALLRVNEDVEFFFNTEPIMAFVGWFFLFNIAIMLMEVLVDAVWLTKRRWMDTVANVFIFLVNTAVSTTLIGVFTVIVLMPFTLLQFHTFEYSLITWFSAILMADFCYYWMHRAEHRSRILWACHVVHHSSEDYNLSVPMRLSWLQDFQEWIFLIPMILVGFDVFQTIVAFILVSQYQSWIHTTKIGRLGPLEAILNTPSAHRVHHGTAHQHIDKNFGGILIIWDRLFGTFQKEDEPVVYGLTANKKTTNPFKINFHEFGSIWRTVCQHKKMRHKLKAIFGSPSWSLNDKKTYL